MPRYKVKGDPKSVSEPKLRAVRVVADIGNPDELHKELQEYLDVLLDRAKVPINYHSAIALMEVADAYFTRAQEIKFRIHAMERRGEVRKGVGSKDPYYLFRTGELEDFIEACKKSVDTGSRRLSAKQYELESEIRGLNQ